MVSLPKATFRQMTSRASGAGKAAWGKERAVSRALMARTLAVGRENVTNPVADGSKGRKDGLEMQQ